MNKALCASPWVHFHVIANGNFYPCCQWDTEQPMGNVQKDKLASLLDSEAMNSLRKNMLEGIKVNGCKRCYELEDNNVPSVRQSMNKKFLAPLELGPHDYSAKKFRLQHFDVRFSNICNLKCRSCGLDFSSSWYEDQIALYGKEGYSKFITTAKNDEFWSDLQRYLQDVTSVYFAGGEPLLEKRHYQMLEYFIENDKTHIEINYTSNFSQLTYDNFKALPYWEKFKNITIYASLDGAGTRGEYLRKNIIWKNIEKNIQTLRVHAPNVNFRITPTLSAYNALHWPDFHKDWVDKGWIKPDEIHTNYLTAPSYMSMQALPREFKEQVVQRYQEHIAYIKNLPRSEKAVKQFENVISFLRAQDFSGLIPDLLKETQKIDTLRKENVFAVFPELAFLNQRAL